MKYNKILILGGIGSGKTTLGRKLSKILKIKHSQLDNIVYKKRNAYEKHKPKIRDKKVKRILKRKKWIIEGFYSRSWTHPIYRQADIIIILKIKVSSSKRRVITRFLKRRISFIKKGENINKKFKTMLKLLKYVDQYPKKYFKREKAIVKKFKKEHIILRNNKEVKEFLNALK